jgi:hypothetical protein
MSYRTRRRRHGGLHLPSPAPPQNEEPGAPPKPITFYRPGGINQTKQIYTPPAAFNRNKWLKNANNLESRLNAMLNNNTNGGASKRMRRTRRKRTHRKTKSRRSRT